jgi:hypothetical protein
VFSYDLAEFIDMLLTLPHQTWCKDVMVGMWSMSPFRITKMDFTTIPGISENPPLLIHCMEGAWWDKIDDDGVLTIIYNLSSGETLYPQIPCSPP